jgi:hypothetical protein
MPHQPAMPDDQVSFRKINSGGLFNTPRKTNDPASHAPGMQTARPNTHGVNDHCMGNSNTQVASAQAASVAPVAAINPAKAPILNSSTRCARAN